MAKKKKMPAVPAKSSEATATAKPAKAASQANPKQTQIDASSVAIQERHAAILKAIEAAPDKYGTADLAGMLGKSKSTLILDCDELRRTGKIHEGKDGFIIGPAPAKAAKPAAPPPPAAVAAPAEKKAAKAPKVEPTPPGPTDTPRCYSYALGIEFLMGSADPTGATLKALQQFIKVEVPALLAAKFGPAYLQSIDFAVEEAEERPWPKAKVKKGGAT